MKKLIVLLLTVSMVGTVLTGCGSKPVEKEGTSKEQETDDGEVSEEMVKIGIAQYVEHDALDASYKGFVDALADAGYIEGENITFDFQNAQQEEANCVTIADKFVNDKVNLILAIATPAAIAVASATQDIPVLVTAVTDPESSGLVETNTAPGGNVSGSSDLTPVEAQIGLIPEILPEAKSVGILYCSKEENSKFQADIAEKACKDLGLTSEIFTISTMDEIQAVVDSMSGKVDVIYSPTDNTIAAGMATVSMVATEKGIPCIVGEKGMVDNGGLASYALDYYNLGKLTGEQAVKILKGEGETATMPIAYLEESACEFSYNKEVAKELGIEIDPTKFQ